MSGHNKWSKIKYVKAKEDAKKGKVFARFAHEIMLAAKSGGGDPDLNPRLRRRHGRGQGRVHPQGKY